MKRFFAFLLSLTLLLALIPGAFAKSKEPEKEPWEKEEYGVYGPKTEYEYVEGMENISVVDEQEIIDIVDGVIDSLGYKKTAIAVGFCYPLTGECAYYNEETWFGCGSLYKLPLCMIAENLLINEDPLGLKADHDVGVARALYWCLVYSNNTYGGALGKCITWTGLRERELELAGWSVEDVPEKYQKGEKFGTRYNVALYTDILRELYANQDDYPHVIDWMLQASPGEYLKHTELEKKYLIAQKYGSTDYVNNAAGIIFTDQPIIVVCLTNIGNKAASKLQGLLTEAFVDYTESKLDLRFAEAYNGLLREKSVG